MQQDVSVHEVVCYVGGDGLTVLRCPNCGTSKTIDTNHKNYGFKKFKAKCKCGASIGGRFEFRKYYRKKVKFSGVYCDRKTGVRGKIEVENISLTGAAFRCLRKHDFQKGDHLDLCFNLDNPGKSAVKLWVEVRRVKDGLVGVKRCDGDIEKPELGFYLR